VGTPETPKIFRCIWGKEESDTPFPWRVIRAPNSEAMLSICDQCWEKAIQSGKIVIDEAGARLPERR
jgi:hypothetical protein